MDSKFEFNLHDAVKKFILWHGGCLVEPGLFIGTKTCMIELQEDLDKYDSLKYHDFTEKDFWILIDFPRKREALGFKNLEVAFYEIDKKLVYPEWVKF